MPEGDIKFLLNVNDLKNVRMLFAGRVYIMKKFLTVFYIVIIFTTLLTGCDFNILGGSKSKVDDFYEPGKRTPSEPPTISTIANFSMDENDIQSVSFQINDSDTFLMCSNIFIKATSSNGTLIGNDDLTVSGSYPNCTLRLTPNSYQFGTSTIKIELYDFWTVVSSSFTLTVNHVETPGAFTITDAEGADRSVLLTWTTPAYMTGTSARYTVFYREDGTTGNYLQITPAASPHLVTGLINGITYDFFIRAQNSVGFRDSNIVEAVPTRFRIQGGDFIAATTQHEMTVAPNLYRAYGTMGDETDEVQVTTTPRNYKVYTNSQGNIISGVGP